MFCPKCKYEYREGFTKCSDCNLELIKELPSEEKINKDEPKYIEYEFLMSAVNMGDIALIKSILESENITYFIQGETNINITSSGAARILVKKEQVEEAKAILKNSNFLHTVI